MIIEQPFGKMPMEQQKKHALGELKAVALCCTRKLQNAIKATHAAEAIPLCVCILSFATTAYSVLR